MRLEELHDLLKRRGGGDPHNNAIEVLSQSSDDVVVLSPQKQGEGPLSTNVCPVCGVSLPEGEVATAHVNRCLDGGGSSRPEGCVVSRQQNAFTIVLPSPHDLSCPHGSRWR